MERWFFYVHTPPPFSLLSLSLSFSPFKSVCRNIKQKGKQVGNAGSKGEKIISVFGESKRGKKKERKKKKQFLCRFLSRLSSLTLLSSLLFSCFLPRHAARSPPTRACGEMWGGTGMGIRFFSFRGNGEEKRLKRETSKGRTTDDGKKFLTFSLKRRPACWASRGPGSPARRPRPCPRPWPRPPWGSPGSPSG